MRNLRLILLERDSSVSENKNSRFESKKKKKKRNTKWQRKRIFRFNEFISQIRENRNRKLFIKIVYKIFKKRFEWKEKRLKKKEKSHRKYQKMSCIAREARHEFKMSEATVINRDEIFHFTIRFLFCWMRWKKKKTKFNEIATHSIIVDKIFSDNFFTFPGIHFRHWNSDDIHAKTRFPVSRLLSRFIIKKKKKTSSSAI